MEPGPATAVAVVGGRPSAEVWRTSPGVEPITGFGCLVCDHHRSVPVVSVGVVGSAAGGLRAPGRERVAVLREPGVHTEPRAPVLGPDVACGNGICPFSCLSVPGTGALWRVLGLWKGKLAVKPP